MSSTVLNKHLALYDQFSKQHLLDLEYTIINDVPIPFSKEWQRIAVNISGGADSACLALVLCTLIQDRWSDCKVDVISYDRCWSNRPWQQFLSKKIYDQLKTMFPSVIGERYACFVPPELEYAAIGNIIGDQNGSQIIMKSFNSQIAFYHDIDAVFQGVTKNPEGLEHPHKMEFRDKPIEEGSVSDMMWYDSLSESFVFRPLIFTEKDWVVQTFVDHDELGLFNMTRSCEGDIIKKPDLYKNIKFKKGWKFKAEEPIPECGTCFWCAERKWAVDKVLGLSYNKGTNGELS